jgi:uncharacterized protein YbaR (Trm112 family)
VRKGLIGLAVGAIAAAWAAKRFFGSNGSTTETMPYGDSMASGGMGASAAAPPARREGLDPTLLEILACPDDKQPVIYQREGGAERLTCTKCGKRYPVRDGIPVMLIDEATPGPVPTEDEIAAAKAVANDGKPAIVGAAAPASAPPASTPPAAGSGAASGTSAPSTTTSPTASGATSGTAAGENAPTGTSTPSS